MKTFEKVMEVLTKNMGYTILFVISIILFAIFSNGLLSGLITAASAILAAICGVQLYNEFKNYKPKAAPAAKPAAAKKPVAKKPAAKKPAAKKAPAKKPAAKKPAAKKAPAKKPAAKKPAAKKPAAKK